MLIVTTTPTQIHTVTDQYFGNYFGSGGDANWQIDKANDFYLIDNSTATSKTLYACHVTGMTDGFVTLDPKCEGQDMVQSLGDIEPTATAAATVPLYRC